MILITGGLGFIGSHVTQALLDRGESCVLVQRRAAGAPDALAGEAGQRIFAEQADITDRSAFLEVGRRHKITGIVHLAGAFGTHGPIDDARRETGSLLNVLQAASDWEVPRVSIASTIGVYGGTDAPSPLQEDLPLPMTSGHIIPAFKKIDELLSDYIASATGIEILSCRISAVWGPLGRPASRFFAAPQLVHAAVSRTVPDLAPPNPAAYADDGATCAT